MDETLRHLAAPLGEEDARLCQSETSRVQRERPLCYLAESPFLLAAPRDQVETTLDLRDAHLGPKQKTLVPTDETRGQLDERRVQVKATLDWLDERRVQVKTTLAWLDVMRFQVNATLDWLDVMRDPRKTVSCKEGETLYRWNASRFR